jgi:hypothetical protein
MSLLRVLLVQLVARKSVIDPGGRLSLNVGGLLLPWSHQRDRARAWRDDAGRTERHKGRLTR